MENQLTKDECLKILNESKNWNNGQTSVKFAIHGIRTKEDDIYDAKRNLILNATKRLSELVT